jgi:AAA domain
MGMTVIIAGAGSTGKSRSIKTLPPEETFLISCIQKPLAFRGSSKSYTTVNASNPTGNTMYAPDYGVALAILTRLHESEALKRFKYIVIDDADYLMRNQYFETAKENGYGKFTDIAVNFRNLITKINAMREDAIVFIVLHTTKSEDFNGEVKTSSIGKLIDEKYNPLENVSVALFTDVQFDETGSHAIYRFATNRVINKQGQILPAKSPEGMFEEPYIANDLLLVADTLTKYFQE